MSVDERLEKLVSEHGDRLQAFGYQLTHDAQAAEDLVQEALYAAYRRWRAHPFVVIDNPVAYVRRSMLNEFLRRDRRRLSLRRLKDRDDVAGGVDHAQQLAARDALWVALARLPARQRAVLVLRYWEDLPDEEIGALLGCRPSSVRSASARGLAAMRTHAEEINSDA